MIYFHKILPVFVLPAGFAILLMIVGLVWRKRAFCWAGVITIWLASLPWVGDTAMQAAEGWQSQPTLHALPPADAIVVLAGGLMNPTGNGIGQWSTALINRFEAGVELYQGGKAPLLLFTNGRLPWQHCAEPIETGVIARAEEKGVPGAAIRTTAKVQNTAEEAVAVANELLEPRSEVATKKIILVTSAFHMRRSKLLFEKAGFTVVAFPADFRICQNQPASILDFFPSTDGLRQTETALREWYGYLYYRLSSL